MRAEQWRKGRRHLLPGKVISYTNYHRRDKDDDEDDKDEDDEDEDDEDDEDDVLRMITTYKKSSVAKIIIVATKMKMEVKKLK